MKKKLLVSISLLTLSLTVSAQGDFTEVPNLGSKVKMVNVDEFLSKKSTSIDTDNSYYYWENNSRITAQLNAQIGTTSSADGGFDTLGLYPYIVKAKNNGQADYWQKTIQGIPTIDSLTLLGITFVGSALNTNGSNIEVNVYKKDLVTLLASETIALGTNYGYKEVLFNQPAVDNDTMLVVWQMATAADSFEIARTHSIWNGVPFGPQDEFSPALSNIFPGDAAIFAVAPDNNSQILGLIAQRFDFFVIPEFSYKLKSDFEVNETELCLDDEVTITNKLAPTHQINPILNFIEWNYLANDEEPAYTIYDLDNGNGPQFSTEHTLTFQGYATAGSYDVTASVMMFPWTAETIVENQKSFTLIATDCTLSLEENVLNSTSAFPNPTSDKVELSFKHDSDINVWSTDGKLIETFTAEANSTRIVNLTNYSNGLYIFNVTNLSGLQTLKVIKK